MFSLKKPREVRVFMVCRDVLQSIYMLFFLILLWKVGKFAVFEEVEIYIYAAFHRCWCHGPRQLSHHHVVR